MRTTYAGTDEIPRLANAYTSVAQVVRESGLMRRARGFYLGVGIVLTLALGGIGAGFVLLGDSWLQLLMAAALGIVFTQAAFLAHEASHGQIMATGPANKRLARILGGVIGMSMSWWDDKHNAHHRNPNRVGRDPDIEVDTISFLAEDAARSKGLLAVITRRQGWLFFPLLMFEGLNLHFLSIKHLVSREPRPGRWIELGLIAAHFAILLIPVFLMLPLGMAFAFIGVQMAVFGVYMGASFAPNHKGMPIIAPDAKLDFFSKQVRTSRNISGGWWATAMYGGLNHQVEHHLFPAMARPHLARAREIVRDYCQSNNVPYTETTVLQSYAIVIRYLNEVGLSARDPWACPMSAQLR
ncbi:fatty acid desaturase [Pseudoclavibacter endophyticus]|uniref:Acyl-CoA desaturase n=1 Tax=Pseudoclavibacter endophyticus TaxID=1778590 RepID=A0A6H9WRT4_9MICO|nr:acyl-CoA desaturase [Pseudoclavibacter endophyticus]KAB1650331.1 acyl-CoA desaturase [Pseudoclavibacter endophyticus]GGA55083.1 fatty acid desaturase [Pseudoclavibacter endophyticus]